MILHDITLNWFGLGLLFLVGKDPSRACGTVKWEYRVSPVDVRLGTDLEMSVSYRCVLGWSR